MNGPPQKPTSACSGSSCARTSRTASRMNGTASSGSGTRSASTSAALRTGLSIDRADVLDELDVDPHPEDRQHDVGEHDRRVDAVDAHGLEGHLRAELGLPADLEQVVALADLAVPRQRAPRLAHEPDRRPLDRLQARGFDEERSSHLEMGRELVVHPPEDRRRDDERDERGDEHVRHVAGARKLPEEERVANREDKWRDGIAVVDEVDESGVVADPGQVEGVEDRGQEEPGQEHRGQQVLDVPEDHRHRGQHEREAARKRDQRQKSGIPAQNVDRVSGMKIRFTGTITASITSSVTAFVATTANGSSCRGNRTCFTRLAWPSKLVHEL